MIDLAMQKDDRIAWLERHFPFLAPAACRLLRSYTNDVYFVTTRDKRYILKVYGRSWRTEAEIRYEVALLHHLGAGGLRIAAPVAGSRGFVNAIHEAGGVRQAVLFAYAEGEKPQPPFTPALYSAFGRAIGRMHALSTDFVTEHPRPPLDLNRLLAVPVAQVNALLSQAADHLFLTRLAAHLEKQIAALSSSGLEWGPIHGDASLDNLHLTSDGDVVLYDFDSGGPGWRAADIQGWALLDPACREKWNAFHEGYCQVRPLDEVNILAAPYFAVIWDIWGMQIDLDNRILSLGQARAEEYLSKQMILIRERGTQLAKPIRD